MHDLLFCDEKHCFVVKNVLLPHFLVVIFVFTAYTNEKRRCWHVSFGYRRVIRVEKR